MKERIRIATFSLLLFCASIASKAQLASNPVIYADVPDLSMIRVGDTYYMSSTTMHMSPGLPIMKSKDLVNWEMLNYAYDRLEESDELNLNNGKSTYGRGSWASSLRYHNGIYYVSTFSGSTGKTYIYHTDNIEKGDWKCSSFKPAFHDHSLFFDDDGRVFMVYGSGKIMLAELNEDLTGIKQGGKEQVLIENAGLPTGATKGLPAEGSQLFKVNGKYYLFNISWPAGGVRTVIVHRSDKLTGPYEGRVVFQDKGVAQGGLIESPGGEWYAYLFRDFGAVGRIPYLVPVTWADGWPVLGIDGKAPELLNLPASRGYSPGIVASDEFNRKDNFLPLVWQWNHQPDNKLWSLRERPGFLRLTTGRLDTSILLARNTLTQRTFGPESSATTLVDLSKMKDGDRLGLLLLQKNYAWIGVKATRKLKSLVVVNTSSGRPQEEENIPIRQNKIYLKIDCNFKGRADRAYFYYSLDGKLWRRIGSVLQMSYTIPHFMGYRFGLFNYATKTVGGSADFDFFRLSDRITNQK